jgi:hypothetical protein
MTWRWVFSYPSCKTPRRRTHGAHWVEGWVVSEPVCMFSSSTPYPNCYTDYIVPTSTNIWVSQMKREYYFCNKYEWTGLLDVVGFTLSLFSLCAFMLPVYVVPYVYLLCYVCIAVLTLDAGLLARNQYPEGLVTGHLDTGFSWFSCVYKRMLRWFSSFLVAATCLSYSHPDLNVLVTFFFHICVHVK